MAELLENMPLSEVRKYAKALVANLNQKDTLLNKKQSKIDTLEFEIAQLKRLLFAAKRERFITGLSSGR